MDDLLGLLIIILPVIAILGMVVARFSKTEKELFKISWDKVAQFIAFLVCIFVFRLLKIQFMLSTGLINQLPQLSPEQNMNKWTMGLVFWEDFFFAVPIYFMMKYMKTKWLRVTLIMALSILFGLGHMYEGWSACFVLAFMPYFVTYNYGKKYGFGTTMLCHILYDMSTIMIIRLLPYLL